MRRFVVSRLVGAGVIGVVLGAFLVRPEMAGTWAAAPAGGAGGEVAKLRQERIDTLREASELATRMYETGLIDSEEVSRWQRELLSAELESAGSAEERTALLRKGLDAARKREELASQRLKVGAATPLAVHEAKAYRLRVELQLAEASAK